MQVDPAALRSICDHLFSADSPTLRQGSASGWKRSFDDELEALFDEVVGDRSRPYGY